jgi:uncharacterized protein DUF5693
MFRRFHWLPVLLLGCGFIASLVVLAQRHRVEARSRAVALVLDLGQLRTLASATGVRLADAYHRFKAAGVTGVAVTEETLADLQSEGALEVRLVPTPTGREYRVDVADPAIAERLSQYVPRLTRGATESPVEGDRVVLPGPGGGKIYIPGRFDIVSSTPTGLDPAAVREVQAAGLEPVGRINNALGLTPEALEWDLRQLKGLGIRTVVFAGEEVLGYRGLIPRTAEAFRNLDLIYGSIEFGKQRGDEALAYKLEDQLVRVHSIASGEMPRLTPGEAIERYVRAAVERNIRLNYVRLPAFPSEATFDDSVRYVERLADDLVRARFGLNAPVPLGRVWPDTLPGRIPVALAALGIGAGALLLLAGVAPLPPRLQAGLAALAASFCALLVLSGLTLGLQVVALLGAVTFPTLAFVLFPQPVGALEEHKYAAVTERRGLMVPALASFAAISVVTLVGAFMVGAVLSELPFMVKVRSFAGIKVATLVPLLLVGWIYLTGMSGEYPSWASEREAVLHRLRAFFSEPIRVWQMLACLTALVAVALLLARSGNDPGVGVSDLELRFRALLDRYLGVRPRTKEFLMGHPALLLALAVAISPWPRWRPWALPLLIIGVIGQVGMLNSFCHLHTPVKVTLLRTINGLWAGALIGLALIGLWIWLQERRESHPDQKRV